MSKFIQLHLLTNYPPSNLNRDDLGRPKTAFMGGAQRLRISSQSLKRAWRTSDVFVKEFEKNKGTRTKKMGIQIYNDLINGGISEKYSKEWAKEIAECFGKPKKADKENPTNDLEIEQLMHFNPEEIEVINDLVKILIDEKRKPIEKELKLLTRNRRAVDIAMFGRMLASDPKYNTEAAVQVAHAITVHKAAIEDDYFTAVDDLNDGSEDMGSAHIGETEFGAGLFYIYICFDKNLLIENLGGDSELVSKAIKALTKCAATISPSGKQNSFASRSYASYILAEKGDHQPRTLSTAFLKPVNDKDLLTNAIKSIEECRDNMDKVYNKVNNSKSFNCLTGDGTLEGVLTFLTDESDQPNNGR